MIYPRPALAFVPMQKTPSLIHPCSCLLCVTDIWDVTGTAVERHLLYHEDYDMFFTQIIFTLNLKRKPLFYLVNIVIPFSFLILVILMVNCFFLYRTEI